MLILIYHFVQMAFILFKSTTTINLFLERWSLTIEADLHLSLMMIKMQSIWWLMIKHWYSYICDPWFSYKCPRQDNLPPSCSPIWWATQPSCRRMRNWQRIKDYGISLYSIAALKISMEKYCSISAMAHYLFFLQALIVSIAL